MGSVDAVRKGQVLEATGGIGKGILQR